MTSYQPPSLKDSGENLQSPFSLHGANMAVPLTVKLLEDKEGQVTTKTATALADNGFLTIHGEETQLMKIKYVRCE